MRTHEGNHPEANHQFYSDDDTLESFGRLTRIYTSLTNYTRAMVQLNSDQGIPVMRPLFLMFQNDTLSYEQDYEYMYEMICWWHLCYYLVKFHGLFTFLVLIPGFIFGQVKWCRVPTLSTPPPLLVSLQSITDSNHHGLLSLKKSETRSVK